jgi:hypothetical protein
MQEESKKRDWIELLLKASTPIVAGLLIAFAGWVTNLSLSAVESKKENARLITELQVKREQAESNLRKDIFDQTLKSLLSEESGEEGLLSQSKRLLRLELLALNFGDSLSLSPLFVEFKNDLGHAEPVDDLDAIDHPERVAVLQKRLRSLARKVSSTQLSSLEQHGESFIVRVPLEGVDFSGPCRRRLFNGDGYKWPDDLVKEQLVELQYDEDYQVLLESTIAEQGTILIDKVSRKVILTFSEVDHCAKTILVNLQINRDVESGRNNDPDSTGSLGVVEFPSRDFRLNFFNFPKVDNTRLFNNHRFAIVMENFDIKDDPHILITGVIFPAEYASLRDRPGMREALKLLRSALEPDSSDAGSD